MKTQDRPLDEDDLAMADLAEVSDWSRVAGPDTDETGPAVVRALVQRVTAGTGWRPWPLEPGSVIDDVLECWGFVTSRGTTMIVFNAWRSPTAETAAGRRTTSVRTTSRPPRRAWTHTGPPI